jgi:hypothetical protein
MTNNEGTIGGKIRGGLMGGGLGALSNPYGAGLASKAMTRLGVPLATATPLANFAIPAAGVLWGGQQSQGNIQSDMGRAVQDTTGGAVNTGLGMAYGMGKEPNLNLPMNPNTTNVSGDHRRMMTAPDGSVWEQVHPGGFHQGQRIGSSINTDWNISNHNKWFNAQLPQWDEIERRKQARAIQNAQISSNIALARQLAGNRQIADLNIAQDANRSMGNMFANTAVPTLAM